MKIKCSPLFTIFVWRFEAGAQTQARAWVRAQVRASTAFSIEINWGRCLLNISRPQKRHMNSYRPGETWCEAAAPVSQPWCKSCSLTAWSLQSDWRAWSILMSFYHYSCNIQAHHWCSLTTLQGSHLVSLKLTDEGHLGHILKHSIAVAVTLRHHLIVGMTVLTEEVVGGSVENWQNLLDISNSPTSYMLLTSQ